MFTDSTLLCETSLYCWIKPEVFLVCFFAANIPLLNSWYYLSFSTLLLPLFEMIKLFIFLWSEFNYSYSFLKMSPLNLLSVCLLTSFKSFLTSFKSEFCLLYFNWGTMFYFYISKFIERSSMFFFIYFEFSFSPDMIDHSDEKI